MNQALNDCLAGWNSIGKAFCGYAAGAFVQSTLLIILLFALDVLWRKRVRAVFRYCVWLLVLAKLVLPPTLSLPSGIGYWVSNQLPAASGVLERVSRPMPLELVERHQLGRIQASDAIPAIQPAVSGVAPEILVAPPAANLIPITWQAIAFLFWTAGVLAFAALLAQRLRFVQGLIAASTPVGGELLDLLEECRRQMGVRRPVGLRTLDTLPSPAVCGLLRPTVLMPASLVEKLSPEGLRTALIHELAHIQRADLWINAVQTFLQVVYFYNPFVWLANAMIRRTCEAAVDETVLVTLGGEAKSYSNTLIDISEMAFWKADFGLRLIGVAESKRALQGRIKRMLTRPIPKSARIGALGTIMILVVAAVLLPMASGKEEGQRGTPNLMDRVQREDDPELAEMIRTALANHKGASEKEILEITRRVAQSRAQILLLDTQIEEINRKIEANPGPGETREKLLLTKKELEAKRLAQMANLRDAMGITPRLPLAIQAVPSLNTWLHLNMVDQRVFVTDSLNKPFTGDWAECRFKSVGLLSEKETLDFLRARVEDKGSLPIRIDVFYNTPTASTAAETLRAAVVKLVYEMHCEMQAEVSLEMMMWVGPGTAPIFLRDGEMRTLYPRSVRRPDGAGRLATGRFDPDDLKQHVLWRLLNPGNVPLTYRIEYDEASTNLARQAADTVKATAKELGIGELVQVTGALVEPTPETAFLGRWQAITSGEIQTIDIQPKGVCLLTTREGADSPKTGATVPCPWTPTTGDIIIDVKAGALGKKWFSYRGYLNVEGNLVVEKGAIWFRGSFHREVAHDMVFQKAQ